MMKRSGSEVALEEFSRKTMTTTMTMSMSMTSSTIPAVKASASASALSDIFVHPPIAHLPNSFHFKHHHHHHQEAITEFSTEAAEPETHILLSRNLAPKLDPQSSFSGNESPGSPGCEGNNPNCSENKDRAARGAKTASYDHDPSYDDDDEEEDAETDAGQSEQSLDPSHLKRLRRMVSVET